MALVGYGFSTSFWRRVLRLRFDRNGVPWILQMTDKRILGKASMQDRSKERCLLVQASTVLERFERIQSLHGCDNFGMMCIDSRSKLSIPMA
jgi:hypothetical protein